VSSTLFGLSQKRLAKVGVVAARWRATGGKRPVRGAHRARRGIPIGAARGRVVEWDGRHEFARRRSDWAGWHSNFMEGKWLTAGVVYCTRDAVIKGQNVRAKTGATFEQSVRLGSIAGIFPRCEWRSAPARGRSGGSIEGGGEAWTRLSLVPQDHDTKDGARAVISGKCGRPASGE
jgi:hypothetical protein